MLAIIRIITYISLQEYQENMEKHADHVRGSKDINLKEIY